MERDDYWQQIIALASVLFAISSRFKFVRLPQRSIKPKALIQMNRWHVLAVVVLVAVLNVAVSTIKGRPLSPEIVTYSTVVASILGGLILLFDQWLWRLPILHPWFVPSPHLLGEWYVTGKIKFLETHTEGTYRGTAKITQTFFAVSLSIDWGDDGNMKFLMKSPFTASSEGFCTFPGLYEWTPAANCKHPPATHRAGFFCHSADRYPGHVVVHYSTVDSQIGVLELTRPAVHHTPA